MKKQFGKNRLARLIAVIPLLLNLTLVPNALGDASTTTLIPVITFDKTSYLPGDTAVATIKFEGRNILTDNPQSLTSSGSNPDKALMIDILFKDFNQVFELASGSAQPSSTDIVDGYIPFNGNRVTGNDLDLNSFNMAPVQLVENSTVVTLNLKVKSGITPGQKTLTFTGDLGKIDVSDQNYAPYNIVNDQLQPVLVPITIDAPKVVTGITVKSAGDAITVENGQTLQMSADVIPTDASDNGVTWSVVAGTGSATIDTNGLLTGTGLGTVTVNATAHDGSGVVGTKVITVIPAQVPVTGVTLNTTSSSILVGGNVTLTPTVAPPDATTPSVIWSSSDDAIATVDNGLVTGVGPGTATITVTTTDGNKTATCAVTVIQPVTGVTLNTTSSAINVGDHFTLTPTVAPTDATDKTVTWSSSDDTVATVVNGLVTGVKAGSATITVKTADGNKTATCDVTVAALPIAVTGVTLDKTNESIYVGSTVTLTPTVAPTDATNKTVSWSSSDDTVATVVNGIVTGVKAGSATITVKTADGNKTATCNVTVTNAPVAVTGVALNTTNASIFVNEKVTLTATVAPSDATNKTVTWLSSNTSVATVDNNGLVTGVGQGTALITVTTADGSKTAICGITVKLAVTGVTLDKNSARLLVGGTVALTPTVTPANATNKTVTWSSTDTSVATVVNGVVTGVGYGTATITVTTDDGNKTAICNVTVSPFVISTDDNALDLTHGITAHATVEGIGNGTVVFELMQGTNTVCGLVSIKGAINNSVLTANFNNASNDTSYWVKVLVFDDVNSSGSTVGNPLATPVTITKN